MIDLMNIEHVLNRWMDAVLRFLVMFYACRLQLIVLHVKDRSAVNRC